MKKYLVCFSYVLMFMRASSMDAVAERIASEGVTYCYSTPQTNDLSHRRQFFSHVAEQHLGVGVDSYVRYAGNPPGGIAKLLRSEFELDPLRFPVLSAVRQKVSRGACCLWCEEIFNVHIKPTVERVVFGIAPMLTMIDGLQQGLDDGRLSEERIAEIILRNRRRFERLANLVADLRSFRTELGGRIGIVRTLFDFLIISSLETA